jgi:hypothetical protein
MLRQKQWILDDKPKYVEVVYKQQPSPTGHDLIGLKLEEYE